MDQSEETPRLLRFFEETLKAVPPVAPAEQYYDRQCSVIIQELSQMQGPVKLLDYGCGQLRLLNAILNTKVNLPEIHYTGTDIQSPDGASLALLKKDDRFETIERLKAGPVAEFDSIVLMNVIHEISLFNIATIFEDIRRLLKPGGLFLLVDMSVLPEGEPLALPFFAWEFSDLFGPHDDQSYSSKTGIPVIFLRMKSESIKVFPFTLTTLIDLVQVKRNTFTDIACRLNDPDLPRQYDYLLSKLSLSGDKVYDLGKLMVMTGHANYRWLEQVNRGYPGHLDIIEASISILTLFYFTYNEKGRLISLNEIFEQLGTNHAYETLAITFQFMSQFGGFFFPPATGEVPLVPGEILDVFERLFTYEDIRKKGIGIIQQQCNDWITGEYQE